MTHRLLALLTLLCALLGACGDDTDDSDDSDDAAPGEAPVIFNLIYPDAPLSVGAQATISSTVDFTDADSDVSGFVVMITAPDGHSMELSGATANTSGLNAGTINIQLAIIPPQAGDYDFDVWLTDEGDHASNTLSGTLTAQ